MNSENASESVSEEMVKVRNITRGCLSFRVPGRSFLLMPGQAIDLPIIHLSTNELTALARNGSVIAATTVKIPDASAKDDSADTGGENIPQDTAAQGEPILASRQAKETSNVKPLTSDSKE